MIKKLVNKNLSLFFNNKTAAEIYTILKNYFQYISSINVICIFFNACNIKFLDFKDVLNYTSCYQIVFNKIYSLIIKNKVFWILKKIIEMTF